MGKGRDKKKRLSKAKTRQEKAFAAVEDSGKPLKKRSRISHDSSDDDEDLEAILESFRAEVS